MFMDFSTARDWVRHNEIQLASVIESLDTATFSCEKCGSTENYPSTVTACVCNKCRKPMEYKGITTVATTVINEYEIIIRKKDNND